jgi:hypothetical protein
VALVHRLGHAAAVMESAARSARIRRSLVKSSCGRRRITQPRSITLETKYQGVPTAEIWTGYAVLVVSKSGKRRVVKGPMAVQLEYDESFEVLQLSTGKPKTTDKSARDGLPPGGEQPGLGHRPRRDFGPRPWWS